MIQSKKQGPNVFLSIDPGVNNCGLAALDPRSPFTVREVHLVKNARKFTDAEKEVEKFHGTRVVKVLAITAKVREMLEKFPDITTIVVEAPFYNALTPAAFGGLLEVIYAIRYSIVIPANLQFKLIEPLIVKKLFANKAMATKEVMRQFLTTKTEDGSIILDTPVDALSEHEIDAIAIGFVHHLSLKDPLSS